MEIKKRYGSIQFNENGQIKEINQVSFVQQEQNSFFELFFHFKEDFYPIITGSFNGLDDVTFIDNYVSLNGIFENQISKFIPSVIIKGIKLVDENTKFIQKINFRSEALRKWIKENHSIDYDSNLKHLKFPEDCEVLKSIIKSENCTIHIYLSNNISHNSVNSESKQKCVISIEFNTKRSVSDIGDLIRKLQKLILFITNDNPIVESICINGSYEMILSQTSLDSSLFSRNIVPEYNLLKDKLGELIDFWFSTKSLEPVIDLIQEKHYNIDLDFHRYLLSTITAFESLDTFVLKTEYSSFTEDDNNRIAKRNLILTALSNDDDLKSWFDAKTKSWLEPKKTTYFIDRFKDKVVLIEKISNKVFNNTQNNFIKNLKNTRDNLAHEGIYDTHFKTFIEIILASKTMEFLVKLLIYNKLGVDIEKENYSLIEQANNRIWNLARINDFKEI